MLATKLPDGLLDLVTFEDVPGRIGRRAAHRLRLLGRALRGRLRSASDSGIRYSRASRIGLEVQGPFPVQADGEFIGSAGPGSPLRLWIDPASMTVLVPGGVNPLFGRAGPG